jgi:hypothetical protein
MTTKTRSSKSTSTSGSRKRTRSNNVKPAEPAATAPPAPMEAEEALARDAASEPPAAVDALDDEFFDRAYDDGSAAYEPFDPPRDPILEHKMSPAVQARRARLTRVVKVAVGGAALFLFVAVLEHLPIGPGATAAAMARRTIPSEVAVTAAR